MTLCPRGRPHPAEWLITATTGHPWETVTCSDHLDMVAKQMTVRGRLPSVVAIGEDEAGEADTQQAALFGEAP